MTALVVVDVASGEVLDTVTLDGGALVFATGVAEGIFAAKRALGLDDAAVFALLTAWSNGYVNVRAQEQPAVRASAAGPSFAGLQAQWEQARQEMLAAWPATAQPMVDELAAQAETAAAEEDLGALGTLAVSAGVIAAVALMLSGGAVGLAVEAAAGVVAEAAGQAVDVAIPDEPGAVRVRQTAGAVAHIIAAGYASGAARAALQVAGAVPEIVRDAVEQHLAGLSTAGRGMVADQIGSLLSAAQHAGRVSVFEQLPPTTRYRAVEEPPGPRRCQPCGDIAGRTYDSLAEGLSDYPAMGYRSCAGGPSRCRGGLHPIWE